MKKKVILLAMVALVSGSIAFAQPSQGGKKCEGTCKEQKKYAKLNLTADQQAKVDAITKKYDDKRDNLMKERDAELKKVLTPEQYNMMLQNRPTPGAGGPRGMMHKGHGMGAPKDSVNRMAAHLNLTADQQTKIDAIKAKYAKQRQELMNNGKTPQENKAAMQSLRDAQAKEINAVLTPEQQQKWQQMKQQRGSKKQMNKNS